MIFEQKNIPLTKFAESKNFQLKHSKWLQLLKFEEKFIQITLATNSLKTQDYIEIIKNTCIYIYI